MLQPTVSATASPATAATAARPAHWHRPDPVGDVLAVAWRPGAAEPREIRVRPELHGQLLAELDPDTRAVVEACHVLGHPIAVRLVVAGDLPVCPGFEVLRAGPATTAG
ncbi:hypothetical protein DQ239_17690 [Blastococcus sp. TF02-09]|uniref:hypothetical protein n=1 Tax=Blastococcus sp. TF02-09 TaxID=2250576 RepID=UPI000DEB8049|nr:hypothetical protein [Blastococcus sp. TF02-9]RBY75170.1 hypothetical protein DQ239_17690 [Blastococcus sp. TF02-9]